MSDIPPKQSPGAQPYDSAEPGSGLVAMYNAASHANAESFPVLKAFQDYIEAERTQARKRVMQLSIFFAVLMVVVVGGFLMAGTVFLRNANTTQDKLLTTQDKLLSAALALREAPPPQPVAAPAPPQIIMQNSPVLEESIRMMTKTTTDIQSSLDKKMDSVNDMTAKVHDRVAAQDSELGKLRDELRDMREQSERLKDELVTMKTPPPAPAPAPVTATPPPQQPTTVIAAAAPLPAPVPAVAAPAPVPPPVAARPDPRFPAPTKEPPATPDGVTAPPVPQGRLATAIPLKTKNTGSIPWRVMIPD